MKKELSTDRLLAELNNDSLSNEKRAEILGQILDMELEKPEAEADMDLIQECFDYLELLTVSDAESEARKAQLPHRLQRTYQRAAEMESDNKDSVVSEIRPVKRKRRFRKAAIAAAIIAAVLLVAMTTLTVIARVNGYGSTWEWLSDHLDEIFSFGNGEQMTIDGITVIKNEDFEIYPNIESWLKEENLEILYPSVLPDGIEIKEVILQRTHGEGEVNIAFIFNSQDISFMAQNYDTDRYVRFDETPEDMELIEINRYQFGILPTPMAEYDHNAYCIVDDFVYVIGFKNRDAFLILVENLKKFES